MTESYRLLIGILLAAVLAISITWYSRRAFGSHVRQKGPDYAYSLPPPVLLVYWVLQPLGAVILNRGGHLLDAAFSLCFSLFLQLSLYNLILLSLLPLLQAPDLRPALAAARLPLPAPV